VPIPITIYTAKLAVQLALVNFDFGLVHFHLARIVSLRPVIEHLAVMVCLYLNFKVDGDLTALIEFLIALYFQFKLSQRLVLPC
jgi:hypothetical protein